MSKIPTRDEALELLKKYNDSDSLVRHGMAVEAVMKHFAEKMGEDPEKWGIIGLVHDLDYEKYPEQHCTMTRQILEEQKWPEDYIRAIMSHAWGMCTDDKPQLPMEKVLYATDELTGLITAAVYVRPSRSILDLTVKSVKKKWKTKSFAAGANREVIMQGAEMLDMPLEELIAETIAGMQKEADALGLRGEV
ncbi:HDIG domain-containing protein [Prolixibacter bellariivorans]|uniref:HDIG domain-containing protein n=1 Tax=Prolixibacter bellariivorans TaxID=314319 RepID=A0A5M4B1F2_9BACT|nr:HDIG domain-containing metalloprotein [Prolixibacter bellariivorans]GET34000.1 HDIG domain-containing protein [Prolixibacter bellariivorans]